MTIKSNVDPSLFVVFMHIHPEEIDLNLENALRSITFRHGESFDPILDKLDERSHQIFFHERYHYWQGIRLPFLYQYANLAFFRINNAFKQLSKSNQDWHHWSCFLPELERLNARSKIGFSENGAVVWSGLDIEFAKEIVEQIEISPLFLLESSASLAEFQSFTSVEKLTDPVVFKRWKKRNPSYLSIFNFTVRYLESETLTLRTFIPLINASFSTTIPERAFAELLNMLHFHYNKDPTFQRLLNQPEPCRWHDIFNLWLDDLSYDSITDSEPNILSPDAKYTRMTINYWMHCKWELENHTYVHPFLGPNAQRWCESEKDSPFLSWFIDQPGYIADFQAKNILKTFSPPISVFRFHIGEGHDKVFMYGTGNIMGFTSDTSLDDPKHHGLLADTVAIYGTVRRASNAHFDESQRLCSHRNCPEYKYNFCNTYTLIPESYENCGFSNRINRIINLFEVDNDDY